MNGAATSLYPLVDRLAQIEIDMAAGKWSFALVSARHDAIHAIVEMAEDMISMPPRRRAKFGTLPYLDLTREQEST
jgi:hypothetical protein